MNELGKIIFLNGLTSSGKTSIINELIERQTNIFFIVGFDQCEETIPSWIADVDKYYSNAIIAMYHAARSFSEQKMDVIIDGLVMNIEGLENHYSKLLTIFDGYPLKMVSVHCPLEICRQRNILRGDRSEHKSLHQSKIAEINIKYDFSIDTSLHTVQECSDLLLSNIQIARKQKGDTKLHCEYGAMP